VGGFTELALTKLDVLDGIPRLPICVAYQLGGEVLSTFPDTTMMEQVTPVYAELPGWSAATSWARRPGDLPAEARAYVDEIERRAGVPVTIVSVGPEREAAFTRAAWAA
jgi:adenylosuccinate synthase